MAKFELTYNGSRYEVEAPDEQSALTAFQSQIVDAPPSNDERYSSALDQVRQSQFPDMNDADWQSYSATAFPPSSFKDVAQSAQAFGFGDEISAATGALGSQVRQWFGGGGPGFGEAYNQYSELEQARRDVGREDLGGLALAADVVGGLSGFGPARGASFGALPSAVNLSTPQALANATITGGVMGGAAAFGTADGDLGQRAEQGVTGAGIGTVVGRFGPTVANAVGGAYNNVAGLLANNSAARSLGVRPEVARMLQETMAADGTLSNAGLARMNAAGGEAMMADAGPSARRMLDTAVQSSGRAGAVARDAIGERVTRDSQAIQGALDQTLGAPEGINAARMRIADETSGARSSAYQDAYSSPIDYSSESGRLIEDLLQRVPEAAIARANRLMQINGERSSQIMAQVGDDGAVVFSTQPDVRQLDYITRALNQEAEAGMGMGAMGGQTDIGAGLQRLSGDIRSVLGNHVPAYENALNVAGDSIRRSQAVRLGADLLSPRTSMEDVIRQSATLSPAEREGLEQGLRSQIDNVLARVRRTIAGGSETETREAQQALLRLSNRDARTKIAAAIGEDRAVPLFDELDRAGQSFELAGSIATGSDTFGRQEMRRRIGQMTDSNGPVQSLMRAEPLNAGKRVVQALTGMTPDRILARQDLINEEIARALTARGGAAVSNMQTLQSLQANGQNPIALALTRGIGSTTLPAANISSQRYSAGSR